MFATIALNFLMGVLGILLFTLLDSKKYFFDDEKEWTFSVFLTENFKSWLFLTLMILIAACISGISPEINALAVFKLYTGIDLIATPAGFFTLGIVIKSILKK